MGRTWRAGIIGAGAIAIHGHIPGYKAVPGVEVVSLCDVNAARVASVAAENGIARTYTDYREMLDKERLDLLSVCSPNAFHADMAVAGLESGANVLCEKPMALTYADACRMVATSERTGKSLTIGFHNRYRPEMRAGYEVVASGKLGELYYAKASMLRRSGIPGYGSWFTNKDLAGGGSMMDIGCHILDLALWWIGHPQPLTVSASTYAKFGPKAKGLGSWGMDHYPAGARYDVDDLATIFVRFEGGATLTLEASWAGHGTDGQRLQVFGTEGGVEYAEGLFGDKPLRFFGEGGASLIQGTINYGTAQGSPYQREIADWLGRIEKGEPAFITATQAAMVVQIVEAAYRSSASGHEVSLVK